MNSLRLLPLLALLTVAFAAEPAKPAALLCPVSDEPITDPANAPSFVYQKAGQPDRVVQFCCEGCIADFKAEPAKYLAKLDARAATAAAAPATPEIKRYALRGVVVAVDADKSALRVKHEEIPGFMRAMTMQFKVDAPTLGAAKVGAALTAQMSRQAKDWVLEDVKFEPAK